MGGGGRRGGGVEPQEGVDADRNLYGLPVVTWEGEGGGGVDHQEGCRIARTWIADPKVYPGRPISMPQQWFRAEGYNGGYRRTFC